MALVEKSYALQLAYGGMTGKGGFGLNGPIESATAAISWKDTEVQSADGVFALLGITTGTHITSLATPWTFNPSTPYSVFFKITPAVTFELISAMVAFQSSDFLAIKGAGIFHIDGYLDTPGTLRSTTQASGADDQFSFSLDARSDTRFPPTEVAETGTTFAALAIGSCVLFGSRKNKA